MAGDSTRRSFGDDMLRPSPNHGKQRLPNDDDDDDIYEYHLCNCFVEINSIQIIIV